MTTYIKGYELAEYTYGNKIEREFHIIEMEKEGWEVDSQKKRLKPNVSLHDAKPEDHEWYAKFRRNVPESKQPKEFILYTCNTGIELYRNDESFYAYTVEDEANTKAVVVDVNGEVFKTRQLDSAIEYLVEPEAVITLVNKGVN